MIRALKRTLPGIDEVTVHDLNDYNLFTAVVMHHGFSAGARALNIPKSRLSRRIALLEKRLGVRLLERSSRGVNLTEVGQRVFAHARAAVIEVEAAEAAALQALGEPRGLVRLSCPIGFQKFIADAIPLLARRYPHLRIHCTVTDRRIDLINEGIDVAIRVRESLDTDAELYVRRIGASRRVLVASPQLAEQFEGLTLPAHLAEYPTLHQVPQATAEWRLSDSNGATTTVALSPILSTGSFDMLVAAASQGLGIALLPEPYCVDALRSGTLVRVLPQWIGVDGIVHLVFGSKQGMLPSVRVVIDALVEALKLVTVEDGPRTSHR